MGTAVSAAALAIGVLGASAGGAAAAPTCGGAKIEGQGSSLQGTAQTILWAGASTGYNAKCGTEQVKYTVSSSGTGLGSWGFKGGAFEKKWSFIGSDDGPNETQINAAKTASGSSVLVIPVAQTAIGVVVNPPANCNVEEITNQQLALVWAGTYKTWNKLSTATGAGCTAAFTRVVRGEGSGTTFQFKNYLFQIATAALACTDGGKNWKQLEPIETGEKPNTVWPEDGHGECAAGTLSPIVTAAGGGGVVKKVNVTNGSIGYAALPDIENNRKNQEPANKNPEGDTHWVKLQNNGLSKKLNIANMVSPLNEFGESANCELTQYTVPSTARTNTNKQANSNWSGVFGGNPNVNAISGAEAYPLCTLTYDIALTNYSAAGFSEAQELSAKDYLSNYVVGTEGQEELESGEKWYAALPTSASPTFDVLGSAQLTASKIGF